MKYIEIVKLIAETITAISAAIILIQKIYKSTPQNFQEFFEKIIPAFLRGGFDITTGKKVYFYKAVKKYIEQKESKKNIINALAKNMKTEEMFIIDTNTLQKFLSESNILTKIYL